MKSVGTWAAPAGQAQGTFYFPMLTGDVSPSRAHCGSWTGCWIASSLKRASVWRTHCVRRARDSAICHQRLFMRRHMLLLLSRLTSRGRRTEKRPGSCDMVVRRVESILSRMTRALAVVAMCELGGSCPKFASVNKAAEGATRAVQGSPGSSPIKPRHHERVPSRLVQTS